MEQPLNLQVGQGLQVREQSIQRSLNSKVRFRINGIVVAEIETHGATKVK